MELDTFIFQLAATVHCHCSLQLSLVVHDVIYVWANCL